MARKPKEEAREEAQTEAAQAQGEQQQAAAGAAPQGAPEGGPSAGASDDGGAGDGGGAGGAAPAVSVRTKSGKPRRRAGIAFGREPVVLTAADITREQAEAIGADPELAVEAVKEA